MCRLTACAKPAAATGVNSANLILSADVGKLTDGSNVSVRFTGGGFNHFISGSVYGTKLEEGITGISLDVNVNDRLWKALSENASLDYLVPGYSASKLALNDGHSKIRQFISACRAYAEALDPNKTAQTSPAPKKSPQYQTASGSQKPAAPSGGVSEKEAYEAAKELGTIEAWEAFLNNFSNGFRADLARAYLKRIASEAPPAAEPAQTKTPPPPPVETVIAPPPPPPLPADISLAVTSQGACSGGQSCSYTVTATNSGGELYSGALTIATSIAPGGARLQGTGTLPYSCQDMGGGAVCSHGNANIAPGQSATIPMTFTLPRNAGGQVTACASIAWGGVPAILGPIEVQRKLNELGFNAGPVDGQTGRKTVNAIRAYQASAGLQQTGEIDLPLLLSLFAHPGDGDANPNNDQTCAGSAVVAAPATFTPTPQPQIQYCGGGRYYSKKRKLCLCPSRKPYWYNNRCYAGIDDCPGDSERIGSQCIKQDEPDIQAGGPQVTGCPANTIRIGNNCVQINLAPLFNLSKKPKGGNQQQNQKAGPPKTGIGQQAAPPPVVKSMTKAQIRAELFNHCLATKIASRAECSKETRTLANAIAASRDPAKMLVLAKVQMSAQAKAKQQKPKPPPQQQKKSKQGTNICAGGARKVGNNCQCPPGQTTRLVGTQRNNGGSTSNLYDCLGAKPPQQQQQQANCTGGRVPNGQGGCACPTNKPRWSKGKCKKQKGINKFLNQLQQQQQQQQPPKNQPQQQNQNQLTPKQQQQLQQGVNQLKNLFSDIRLKRDVEHLTTLESGIKLYSFRYLWDDTVYVGVMAQDLLDSPSLRDAVTLDRSGYYRVDYPMLGLKMVTLERYRERGLPSVMAEPAAVNVSWQRAEITE